jgi:hypothetical protein
MTASAAAMPYSGTTAYLVRVGDLPRLRARVEEIARQDHISAERLLGQLATLETAYAERSPMERITFHPPAGCEDLAQRAVALLHAGAFGMRTRSGRFRRAS